MYCKSVNAPGIRNKRHAIRADGIRSHEPDEPEIDVLMDGLNLARAMSYKNALAAIPYGGSKILVQCAPIDLSDFEVLGFLAYIIDRTRSFTGLDMGFEPSMASSWLLNGPAEKNSLMIMFCFAMASNLARATSSGNLITASVFQPYN